MQVHQHDISDVLRFLPDLKPFDEEGLKALRVRLFICTLGFEDRTSCVVKKLAQRGVLKDSLVLLICYPTNEEENSMHLVDFEAAALSTRGLRKLEYSRLDFSQRLAEFLAELEVGAGVVFDVSTCSSYVFYPTMRSLVDRDVNLSIVYTEAEIYYPTELEWQEVAERAEKEGSLFAKSFEEADFQSLGVENVYPYSIFSEMNPGNRASALVAIPNFSALRMNAMIARDRELNKTAFRNVVWILGDPPAVENKWRIEAIKRTNDLGQNVKSENLLLASTLYYKEMLEVLETIWLHRRYSLHVSVGSLGSKMQHLGTFLFLLLHQEVAIWLAEPSRFQSSRFSKGADKIWQVEFGRIDDLCENLSSYMTFGWHF